MQYASSVSLSSPFSTGAVQDVTIANESSYRATVASDVFLLKFLENNTLENRHGFAKNELSNDPTFIDWISPYFYTSFTTFGKTCIAKANAGDWIALLDNPILMNEKFKADAWDVFEKEIRAQLTLLQSVVTDRPAIGLTDIGRLSNFNFIRLLKKLPVQRFHGLMDDYAEAIGNAAVIAFKKGDRDMSGIYLDNALALAFSTSVKNELEKKRNDRDVALDRMQPGGGSDYSGTATGGGQTNPWVVIRVVLLALILIVRLATCRHY